MPWPPPLHMAGPDGLCRGAKPLLGSLLGAVPAGPGSALLQPWLGWAPATIGQREEKSPARGVLQLSPSLAAEILAAFSSQPGHRRIFYREQLWPLFWPGPLIFWHTPSPAWPEILHFDSSSCCPAEITWPSANPSRINTFTAQMKLANISYFSSKKKGE